MAWDVGVARVTSAVLLGLALGGYASGAGAGGTPPGSGSGSASGNDAVIGLAQAAETTTPSNVASGDDADAVAGGAQTADWVSVSEATRVGLAGAETDRMHSRDFDSRQRLSATHPNELWRLYGAQAAGNGQWSDAARHFRRAARFADKYSQHRLSLLYWHGLGVAEDRALAYAWADLAAERGYPQFLLIREKMWSELDAAQRQRALAAGPAIFDEYADAVAKPRLTRAIAHARAQTTGSRTGLIIAPLVVMASRGGSAFDATDAINLGPMYADWRMDSKRYWAVEDAIWQNGNVEVGPVQKAGPSQTP